MTQTMDKTDHAEPIEGRLDREIEMLCRTIVLNGSNATSASELEVLLAERAAVAAKDKTFMVYIRGATLAAAGSMYPTSISPFVPAHGLKSWLFPRHRTAG